MLVELEQAIGWLKENADKYIVDMAIPSNEHDYHIGDKCWEDLKAAMPEAERPKIKATLLCEAAEVKGAVDETEAEALRKELDGIEVKLDFVPGREDNLTVFCKGGWCDLKVKSRCVSYATLDACVKARYKDKEWIEIDVSEIEIMERTLCNIWS